MSEQYSQPTKPHMNVGTIGHVGSGKATLTGALAAVPAKAGAERGDDGRDGQSSEDAVGSGHVEYETAVRHYAHVDGLDAADWAK